MRYHDREHAGRTLASLVRRELEARGIHEPVVVGLPRGGVPVAAVVARALGVPLAVWVSRKVGAPGHEEVGIGAVSEGGTVVLDERLVALCGVSDDALAQAVAHQEREVAARCRRFRAGGAPPPVAGRTVLVVDDGVANGVTARAALRSLRAAGAASLILVVPVGSADGLAACAADADLVLCPLVPPSFGAVGAFYDHFDQVQDSDVMALLASPS